MLDFETTLAGIGYKLRRILEENATLKGTVQELTETNTQLTEELKRREIENNNLCKQINIVKLRNTLATKGNAVETKLKINQLIRNIDKSLELLNKRD